MRGRPKRKEESFRNQLPFPDGDDYSDDVKHNTECFTLEQVRFLLKIDSLSEACQAEIKINNLDILSFYLTLIPRII